MEKEKVSQREPNWWKRAKERVVRDPFQFDHEVFTITGDFEKQGIPEEEAVSFVVGKMVAGMDREELRVLLEGVRRELEDQEHHSCDPLDGKVTAFTRQILRNLESISESREASVLKKNTAPMMPMDL